MSIPAPLATLTRRELDNAIFVNRQERKRAEWRDDSGALSAMRALDDEHLTLTQALAAVPAPDTLNEATPTPATAPA